MHTVHVLAIRTTQAVDSAYARGAINGHQADAVTLRLAQLAGQLDRGDIRPDQYAVDVERIYAELNVNHSSPGA